MNFQTFKENIEYLTGEAKQNKIADVLNISASKLSKWFTGELLPTFADILNISKKYGCSIDWLIGNDVINKNISSASVYDVCKSIVFIDSAVYMKIKIENVTEPYTYYDREAGNCVKCEKKVERPIIYLCTSMDLSEREYEFEGGESVGHYLMSHSSSTLIEHEEINRFIIKYSKLKQALMEGLIDIDSFDHMVKLFLDELSRIPIDYFRENPIGELPFE